MWLEKRLKQKIVRFFHVEKLVNDFDCARSRSVLFTERFGNYMLLIQGHGVHNEASWCGLIINTNGLRCHEILRHPSMEINCDTGEQGANGC